MTTAYSPNLDTTIKELQSRVDEYSKYSANPEEPTKVIPSFSFGSKHVYMAIPAVVLCLILYFQPNFVKNEKLNSDGTITQHVGFTRIIMWTLILSLVGVLGVFGYNYKKSTEL